MLTIALVLFGAVLPGLVLTLALAAHPMCRLPLTRAVVKLGVGLRRLADGRHELTRRAWPFAQSRLGIAGTPIAFTFTVGLLACWQ